MNLNHFQHEDLYTATKRFIVEECRIPLKTIQKGTVALSALGLAGKKEADAIEHAYAIGLVDDEAFAGSQQDAEALSKLRDGQGDYPGIVIIAIELRGDHYPRGYFAQVTRFINRQFKSTPVAVMFKYGTQLSFANIERTKYQQEWREGEKVGRVSILRDVNYSDPHSGHLQILSELRIDKQVDSYASLYAKWQEVFSVSVLNKKFYTELSNWYFWAIKHVIFPNEPTEELIREKYQLSIAQKDYQKVLKARLEEANHEHKATNVIRLLTRLLFTWFIKEKRLIPDALFNLKELENNILKEIAPYHDDGMFATGNKDSIYYKAILQNLFFATLNCPIEADKEDTRTRGFRSLETAKGKDAWGKHFGVDWLMRYKKHFKDPDGFLKMVNETVPFLNGGLFECLDDKPNKLYIDGFSDSMVKGEQLVVPDYLFFGVEEKVDLSNDLGINNKGTKQAAVKGLINILKAYKFTITENTPIEEDVALDPELLGKVFENLLASYNPETKTTARKQTGSFYTPREIVNYMVDESLIAYLKNAVADHGISEDELDKKLHQLASFDTINPFETDKELSETLVHALDRCKILDPACGSGAFPMGVLQKMVHMLQKLDPKNTAWKHLQLEKAMAATEDAFAIENKDERAERLQEINEAFDEQVNNADYARKLFLIENCIFGVDIQPIATQISKLRFFISLVVDQKVRPAKPNFGIRPLPNLETRFVTANTLIGIDQIGDLFEVREVKQLEAELKVVRHKMFSLKSPKSKNFWRGEDLRLRKQMATLLEEKGLPSKIAGKLASWDPYSQKESAPFFDPEWMFDVTDGFDVVIGNPPYIEFKKLTTKEKEPYLKYQSATGKFDLYVIFLERGIEFCADKSGVLCFINPTTFMRKDFGVGLRSYLQVNTQVLKIHDFVDLQVFEGATNYTGIFLLKRTEVVDYSFEYFKYDYPKQISGRELENELRSSIPSKVKETQVLSASTLLDKWEFIGPKIRKILSLCEENGDSLSSITNAIFQGVASGKDEVFYLQEDEVQNLALEPDVVKPILKGKDIKSFKINWSKHYVLYPYDSNGDVLSETTMKSDFPNSYDYLVQSRPLLSGRPYFEKSSKRWYELWNQRSIRNFQMDRIVTTEISAKNNFILTNEFLGNTKTYHILLKIGFDNHYILALLNSSLLEYYYHSITTPQAGGFYAYKTQFLNRIPIKHKDEYLVPIRDLCLIQCFKNGTYSDQFKNILNATVFNLYFPDHMLELGIDVLPFVEADLKAVLDGREFEKLKEAQKEEVIAQLHQKWSSPNNEVVKRMAQFKEKSPDILKVILES